ncbi:unnamed protein product [Symbiodinium sp. CCMP2592]|nr:unnamed protein product [Symbiodinium sp. CCMP2592]
MCDGEPVVAAFVSEADRFVYELEPKDLATTVWARAKLLQLDEPHFDVAGERVSLVAYEFRAHDLALIAWTAGKAQHAKGSLMDMLGCSFLAASESDAATLANMARSWASLRSKGIALMSAAALEAAILVDEFYAQHLASAFQAFTKLLLHGLNLMPATGARARLIVTEPDPQQLSNTLRALGRLSFSGQLTTEAAAHQVQSAQHLSGPQEASNRTQTPTSSVFLNLAALEGLADQASRMATHFDPQGLAMVAWSFATCELRDLPLFDIAGEHVSSIVHALARRVCAASGATELGPQSPSNLARALGRPELRGSPVLDAAASAVMDRSSECSPLNSANLAWGFGTLRDAPGSLLTALVRESMSKLPEPSGQQLANMVWGFAWLSFVEAGWMEAHPRFARPLLPEYTPQGLCNTARKPAKLVVFEEALMMSACHEAQNRFHLPQPQNFSNFVWAFSIFHLLGGQLMNSIGYDFREKLPEFDAQAITNTL